MEKDTHTLEINLISAQGLKTPSANLRRMQTYAVLWVDSSNKLRTQIDRIGGENPTWNDKFLFRVSRDFVSGDTSGVSVEIYAVGYIKDYLLGTVRFLLSSCFGKNMMINPAGGDDIGTPAFTAVQIRRPSGRFHGVLNIAAAVRNCAPDFAMIEGLPAVCFRDLIGEKEKNWRRKRRLSRGGSKRSEQSSGGESCDFDLSSMDLSDGADSTTSSSSAASTALKDCNGCLRREMAAGKRGLKSVGGGMLCGLMLQRKIPSYPSDQNLQFYAESFEKEG